MQNMHCHKRRYRIEHIAMLFLGCLARRNWLIASILFAEEPEVLFTPAGKNESSREGTLLGPRSSK